MISARVHRWAREVTERLALRVGRAELSYGEWAARAAARSEELREAAGLRIGLAADDPFRFLIDLVALDQAGSSAVLLPAGTDAEVERLCAEAEVDDVLENGPLPPAEAGVGRDRDAPQVVLFTSGTTGIPKPATHSWDSLARGVRRRRELEGRSWLLSYDMARFAGLAVILQALETSGTLIRPPSTSPADVVRALREAEMASGSPSFWRMVLRNASPEELASSPLRQITLGGEAADQVVLDGLRQAFPRARITHVYASTELGSVFAVRDNRAGFPSALTEGPAARLRVSPAGELEVRPGPGSMRDVQLGNEEWFATGDLVEARDDRYEFVGRLSDTINVGGRKVLPLRVEQVIRGVPGVLDVRVHALASSVIGQIVGAEVQPLPDHELGRLRAAILTACRATLAKHEVPSLLNFRAEGVSVTAAGKADRNGPQS